MRSPAQRVILPVLLLAWALPHAAVFGGGGRPEPGRTNAKEAPPLQRIRRALEQPVTLDFSGQSLQEALQHVRDKAGIEVNLDQVGLALVGVNVNDNGDQPVILKSNGVKLGAALRKMLAGYQLAYVIYEDAILITSSDMVTTRQMKQRVSIDVNEVPLNKALRDLARAYVFNLVIDPKIAKDAGRPVSLTLEGASLDTSVRLLAEMAGLKAVRMDNVLFVTNEERAEKIRREDKDLQPGPADDNAVPPNKAALGAVIGGAIGAGPAIRPLPPTVNQDAPDVPPAPPLAPPLAPGDGK